LKTCTYKIRKTNTSVAHNCIYFKRWAKERVKKDQKLKVEHLKRFFVQFTAERKTGLKGLTMPSGVGEICFGRR
jgi:hypothetical protein